MGKAKDTDVQDQEIGVMDESVAPKTPRLSIEEFVALQNDPARRAQYTKYVYEVGTYSDNGTFVPAKFMMTMIPDEGMILPEGTTHRFIVNEAIWDIPVGEMLEVPEEIGRMIQERFRTKGKSVFLLDPRTHQKGNAIAEIM